MSQPIVSGSEQVRRKRVKPEDKIIEEIIKLQKYLMKEHKRATLFSYLSNYGLMQFGSDNVVEKFGSVSEDLLPAFNQDDEQLKDGTQLQDDKETEQEMLIEARASLLPSKLPSLVHLLRYEELWQWISREVLKEHWQKGGKSKHVKYGYPEFEPSFWLGDLWEWESVVKHPKDLTKASYTGPGNMTDFLKKVVANKLAMLGINPDMWVSDKFTEEEKQRRERTRKKSTPSILEAAIVDGAGDTDESTGMDDEEADANDAMNETFAAEENLYSLGTPNVSNIIGSGANISNLSGIGAGQATSSVNDGITRRCSERQAAKRARLQSLPSLSEEHIPSLISPMSSDDELPSLTAAPSGPDAGASPSNAPQQFVPRRKPLPTGNSGTSNFYSPLNVDVGENLHSKDDFIEMRIPDNLVTEFELFSRDNTEHRIETGGILGGVHEGDHFRVTHLIIPEQTGRSDKWEVQDVRQITNYFTYNELIMLGLIHTHPGFSSFLSSVDLHALWDYARENKNLISIVLAPEEDTAPAFCLTNVGLEKLRKCKDKGFHRHKNDRSYYMIANHAIVDQTSIIVQDFRIDR